MLFVVWRCASLLLFVVRCSLLSLSDVCRCVLFVVRCVLSVVRCRLFVVGCLLCVDVCCLPFVFIVC